MIVASGLAAENSPRPAPDWAAYLKDAVLAGLAAALLALPLMGLQTYDIGGGALGIRTHFDWVAIAAAAVFAGRLALRLWPRLHHRRDRRGDTGFARFAAWANRRLFAITLAGIAVAVALPFLPFSSRYLIDLGTTVLIYVMLGWGSTSSSGSPACSISATSRFTPSAPIPSLSWRATWGLRFGRRCRSRAWWRRASGSFWGFLCCACAAIIWRSSPSALARSSASCC